MDTPWYRRPLRIAALQCNYEPDNLAGTFGEFYLDYGILEYRRMRGGGAAAVRM